MKKVFSPILLPIVSVPHFLLGCFLASHNWNHMGYSGKAKAAVKWGIIGTVFVIAVALYLPAATLKLMWPVGIGVNIGAGMALRTLQSPDYHEYLKKRS